MTQEPEVDTELEGQPILEDLRKQRFGEAEVFRGSPELLQRVRQLEHAEAGQLQTISIASARGEDIEKLALLDSLTELYNQRTLLKELKSEVNRARRYRQNVSVCMLAADGLESIKSQLGQLTFDAVQKVVSNVIRDGIREVDFASRYTPNEFVVVLPQTHPAGAALTAERLRQRVGNQAIVHNWQTFSVTASIGVACFPQNGNEYDELLARAWEALEYARERGGDRVFCI